MTRRRILSLDVDGVLINHPDVELLMHSSWRETYTPAELQDMLHPLEARFAGVAPPGERGAAIAAWKRSNAPDAVLLAIDDDVELHAQPGIEVLHCDPRRGLSDIGVQRAVMDWLERTQPSAAR